MADQTTIAGEMDNDSIDDGLSMDATRGSISASVVSTDPPPPTPSDSFFSTFSDIDSVVEPRASTPILNVNVPSFNVVGMDSIHLDQSQSVVILDAIDADDSIIFVGEYYTPPPSPLFDTIDLE